MARKPHNYAHFQNLVNELKDQNQHNFAGLQTHLETQTSVLESMRGFMLKGVQQDNLDERRKKEDRLEGKKEKSKGLTMKSKQALPKFSGKGFMGMLGNFLSTALIGIPGGLRRFLPAALGMSLIPKLAQGVALMVAGPNLIKALEAGFSQKTFGGGVSAFMDSYFSSHGEAYTSLGAAAAGGAGKGALLGFGLLGPRGAIIGGILGGALTGLNHIFTDGSGKMDSKGTVEKVKAYMLDNAGMFAGVTGALMGAKWGIAGGPAGIIAGAMIGGGLGYMGAGVWKEMLSVEEGGGGAKTFKEGLVNWYKKIDWGSGAGAAGAGAIFFAALGAGFGPHGIIAGALLGSAVGLLGGPILTEALKIEGNEGKGMADAMKKATWNYVKKIAKNPYVTSALAGAVGGGILGGVGSLPGIVAGAIIGAIFGVIVQWLTNTIGEFAGEQFAKVFGIEKVVSAEQKKYNEAVEKHARKGTFTEKLLTAKSKKQYTGKEIPGVKQGINDPFTVMQRLKEEYLKLAGGGWSGTFDPVAAQKAAWKVKSVGEKKGDWKRLKEEVMALKLMQLKDSIKQQDTSQGGASSTMVNAPQNTQIKNEVTTNSDFVVFQPGLIDGSPSNASLYFR